MTQGFRFDISLVRNTSFSCQSSITDFAEFQLPVSDLERRFRDFQVAFVKSTWQTDPITFCRWTAGNGSVRCPSPEVYPVDAVMKRSRLMFLVLTCVFCISL